MKKIILIIMASMLIFMSCETETEYEEIQVVNPVSIDDTKQEPEVNIPKPTYSFFSYAYNTLESTEEYIQKDLDSRWGVGKFIVKDESKMICISDECPYRLIIAGIQRIKAKIYTIEIVDGFEPVSDTWYKLPNGNDYVNYIEIGNPDCSVLYNVKTHKVLQKISPIYDSYITITDLCNTN